MFYYILAVICSIFYAVNGTIAKRIYKFSEIDEYSLAWISTIISIPVFIPIIFFYFTIPSKEFILPFILAVFLNMIAFTFLFKAIKFSDISIVFPLLSTTPLFMLITSPLLLNEKVNLTGGAGIIIITIGVYYLSLRFEKDKGIVYNIKQPFKSLIKDKGAVYAIIVAIIWSLTSNLDKYCILQSNPFVYAFLFKFTFLFTYLPVVLICSKIISFDNYKKDALLLLLLGLTDGLVLIFQFTALKMIKAPYIIAIKRGGMFFVIFAGWFFFKEKNIKNKFIGALFIMLGFILIIFYG